MYSKDGKKPSETTLGPTLMADILKFIYVYCCYELFILTKLYQFLFLQHK